MAKQKKRQTKMEHYKIPSPEKSISVQARLEQIANKLGTSVTDLLESYGDAQTVIERFDSGNIQLLSEELSEVE
jgi:hypothetical protein